MGRKGHMWVNHGIYWSYGPCTCHSGVIYRSYGSYMGYDVGGHLWVILVFCGSYGLTMGHVYVINGSTMGHYMYHIWVVWVMYGSTIVMSVT